MDREFTKQEIRARLRRQILIYGGSAVAVVLAVWGIMVWSSDGVDESHLTFGTVDRGDIDAGISASGVVVPAFEQAIITPITTSVREIHHHPGDIVEAGTSLVSLDLEQARTDYENNSDALTMKQLELEQLRANNNTTLSNLEMQIKVERMKLDRQQSELANERHLDSIGTSTAERVRELELACRSGALELAQLQAKLENERKSALAAENIKSLSINVAGKDLNRTATALADAEIRAPRRATVTWIVNEIGTQISAGSKVATVADLGHYKVDGEVVEHSARSVFAGMRAIVRVGNDTLTGFVSNVAPTAQNGMVSFSVALNNDSASFLRPGTRPNVTLSHGIVSGVVRMPNVQFYDKPGPYTVWVRTSDNTIEPRQVILGAASFNHIEVEKGLSPGDRIVLNNMDRYNGRKQLRLRK